MSVYRSCIFFRVPVYYTCRTSAGDFFRDMNGAFLKYLFRVIKKGRVSAFPVVPNSKVLILEGGNLYCEIVWFIGKNCMNISLSGNFVSKNPPLHIG